MGDESKRDLRREKREIKKAGVRRARRGLKRALAEDPESAPPEAPDYGKLRSAPLNGIDRDATRRRPGAVANGRLIG